MELRNNYVWWDEHESETIHGSIVKIEPITEKDGKQKTTTKGIGVSRIVFRTGDGDVNIRIVDTQRPYFEPKLGQTGNISHDHTNNYLNFEEDDEGLVYGDAWDDGYEPKSIEELFQYVDEEVRPESMKATLDKVEEYVEEINKLLNKAIQEDEDDLYWAYVKKVRDANIETGKELLSIRMRDVV